MYEEIFKELDEKGVRYLVVGGVAVVLHGFLRATADLDLMIDLGEGNVRSFLDVAKARGYKPRPPVQIEDFALESNRRAWRQEKGMRVFSLWHPDRPQDNVDVFVDEPIPFEEAYARRKVVPVGEAGISVLSIPDLIRLKQAAGRKQDLEDIRALREIDSGGPHEP
ncbi:MAG: hypothetical protein HY922_15760 [Elusimicrobia bacterium]|nr:hypothetical protein [Elusimicrobiota bacterium]